MPRNPVFLFVAKLQAAKDEAQAGVDYTLKDGAVCPFCGSRKLRPYTVRKWDGGFKIRYHYCENPDCGLATLRFSIKSVQQGK